MKSKILAAVLAAMLLLALTACGEKLRTKRFRSKEQYASMHRVSSFQWNQGSLRPLPAARIICSPGANKFHTCRLIPKPVKKLEKLFIAPKVRQVLYETSQRVFTRCACAQRTGFLIKFFNQESVSELKKF